MILSIVTVKAGIGALIGIVLGLVSGYYYIYFRLAKKNLLGDGLTDPGAKQPVSIGNRIVFILTGLMMLGIGILLVVLTIKNPAAFKQKKGLMYVVGAFCAMMSILLLYSGIFGGRGNKNSDWKDKI